MDRGWIFRHWSRWLAKQGENISYTQYANSPKDPAIDQKNLTATQFIDFQNKGIQVHFFAY